MAYGVIIAYDAVGLEPLYLVAAAAAPVVISATPAEEAPSAPFFGTLLFGGNLYALSSGGSHTPGTPIVYKSTDGGATWTDISTATLPTNFQSIQQLWDETSGVIHFFGTDDGSVTFRMVDFDLTTGWGPYYGTSGGPGNSYHSFALTSAGDFVFYTDSGDGFLRVLKSVLHHNSATWTVVDADLGIPSGASISVNPESVIIDATDRIHVFTGRGYYSVSSGDSLSSFVDFVTTGLWSSVTESNTGMRWPAISQSGDLKMAVLGVDGNPAHTLLMTGAAPLTSPTWSIEQVGDVNPRGTVDLAVYQDDGGIETVFWPARTSFTTDDNIYQSQKISGVWTMTTFWDSTANPNPDGHGNIDWFSVGLLIGADVTIEVPTGSLMLSSFPPVPKTPFTPPPPPPPPPSCELNPVGGTPTLVLYDEPLELQGS
ncbi:MAG TPA: hypothetical protein VJQ59_16725 [Candidatus Sulfotelmatobacter sp.]|nr:hypothetical protein [Candidatus Sulfotelmatobacter sp.]